ncbi:hypothetical protein L873DRAFT_1827230 [Choiromyces venosus 120613-1]|uniref:Carboxymuconolactone decarboxylase-like domain-containing protein n=1 Tax=Choiromyces venosus 120613-1 TaxID=1336337 RepID=A0A3N4JSQ6_9PEZI|nr:hypothetical protein L873DRAFT_1827230 [Choiromyces venosus 120613-1]
MPLPLSPIATLPLLRSLHHHPNLPKHTFYFVASVAFSVINRPEEIPRVWKYVVEEAAIPGSETEEYVEKELLGNVAPLGNRESALTIHRKLREAILKSAAIGGLPKAVNSLNLLKAVTTPHILSAPTTTHRRLSLQPAYHTQTLAQGSQFFETVYGKVTKRVMGGMRNSYDDLAVVAELIYGHVLSNAEVIGARDTSFCLVAGLIPQDVNPQLKGHLRGALNNGATAEEVMAVREVVLRICREAGCGLQESEVVKL